MAHTHSLSTEEEEEEDEEKCINTFADMAIKYTLLFVSFFLLATNAITDSYTNTTPSKSSKKKKNASTKPYTSSSSTYKGGPWLTAHATFYGNVDARETMGGACGYGNLHAQGYGINTAAISSILFNNGYGCGGCYEISCAQSNYCYSGSTVVTATNLCPPNWYKPSNNGGWCNQPRVHFDMSKPAFMKIAYWRAGIVPVNYRRVPCRRKGNINFQLKGNKWWLIVFITNVGGSGDIKAVSIKGSNTAWLPMTRNWGTGFQVFQVLENQCLSFRITSYTTGKTITLYNVAPSNWQIGQTYSAGQMS